MLLSRVSLDKVKHLIDKDLSSLDVKLQSLERIFGLIVLFGCFVPHRFAFIIHCDLVALLNAAFLQIICVGVHFSMGLGHDKGLFFTVGHDGELNCFFPKSSFFTIIGNDGGYGGGRTFVSENGLRLLKIVEVAKIDPNDVFPSFGLLICLFCLFECSLRLFGLSVLDLDGFRHYFVHDWGSLFEHLQLKIQSRSFFIIFSLFIDLCRL